MSLSAKEISVNHTEKEIEIPGRVSTKSISNGGLGGGFLGYFLIMICGLLRTPIGEKPIKV
jgi:hypothetical protein